MTELLLKFNLTAVLIVEIH